MSEDREELQRDLDLVAATARKAYDLEVERDRLREALERYGTHDRSCPIVLNMPGACDCGLDAALAGSVSDKDREPSEFSRVDERTLEAMDRLREEGSPALPAKPLPFRSVSDKDREPER